MRKALSRALAVDLLVVLLVSCARETDTPAPAAAQDGAVLEGSEPRGGEPGSEQSPAAPSASTAPAPPSRPEPPAPANGGDGASVSDAGAGSGSAPSPSVDVDAGPTPRPRLLRVEPGSVPAGLPSVVLRLYGEGFGPRSLVLVEGVATTTRFRSPTHLEATMDGHRVQEGGVYTIAVRNPTPGGGLSEVRELVVAEASPEITGLAPASAVAGSGPLTVTVAGRGFQTTALVRVDEVAVPTTRVSSEALTFELGAAALAVPGPRRIEVLNFGAAPSAAYTFVVVGPSP